MTKDTRYPYTYAADYIRGLAGWGDGGTKLSRSDASKIREGIARAIGMPDDELANRLADHWNRVRYEEEPITTDELLHWFKQRDMDG